MSTTVPANYAIDVTNGADEFSPLRIVGQRAAEIDRIILNNTHLWSRMNLRRLVHYGNEWAPIPVLDVAFAEAFRAVPVVSAGRSRIFLTTDARECEIRMTITTRAGVPIGASVTNVHGIGRSQISGTYTGNTTNRDILVVIEIQTNGILNPLLYTIRVRELRILQADLWPILPS